MTETGRDEFYVGYRPKAPRRLGRLALRGAILLALLGGVLAFLLTALQGPFGPGVFEFGVVREFEGILAEKPYPTLLVERPGRGTGGPSRYTLVAIGKRGADEEVAGLDGRPVRMEGSLIYRDGETMIELRPGSVRAVAGSRRQRPGVDAEALGTLTLAGEIVDSKCYLGVMKPGEGKTHRACAVRCISGGVPAALLVETTGGERRLFFLTDEAGAPVGARVLDLVAEPVEIIGRASRRGEQLFLAADPASYRRLSQ